MRQDGGVTSAPVLWRRLAAEFLGSAFLAAIVIGSGIAAQRLSPGNTGLQLLYNSAATAAGLFAIILMFGPLARCLVEIETAASPNITLATTAPATQPATWAGR